MVAPPPGGRSGRYVPAGPWPRPPIDPTPTVTPRVTATSPGSRAYHRISRGGEPSRVSSVRAIRTLPKVSPRVDRTADRTRNSSHRARRRVGLPFPLPARSVFGRLRDGHNGSVRPASCRGGCGTATTVLPDPPDGAAVAGRPQRFRPTRRLAASVPSQRWFLGRRRAEVQRRAGNGERLVCYRSHAPVRAAVIVLALIGVGSVCGVAIWLPRNGGNWCLHVMTEGSRGAVGPGPPSSARAPSSARGPLASAWARWRQPGPAWRQPGPAVLSPGPASSARVRRVVLGRAGVKAGLDRSGCPGRLRTRP